MASDEAFQPSPASSAPAGGKSARRRRRHRPAERVNSVLLFNLRLNLALHKERLGLSDNGMARLTGSAYSYYKAVIEEGGNLSILTIEKIASRLGVDPIELLSPPKRETRKVKAD